MCAPGSVDRVAGLGSQQPPETKGVLYRGPVRGWSSAISADVGFMPAGESTKRLFQKQVCRTTTISAQGQEESCGLDAAMISGIHA